MRVLGVMLAVTLVAMGAEAPPPATDLHAQPACDDEGRAHADLSWSPPSGIERQRVDVTIDRDGFATGEFDSSDALPASQDQLRWDRLEGQAIHYWRVMTFADDGETSSEVVTFEGPTCPVDYRPEPGAVERIAGEGRVATAIAVSRKVHTTATTVIIARMDAYPDALASASLAGLLDAPVLLTPSQRLAPAVGEEIARLEAASAILLGGTAALSSQVEDAVQDLGLTTERLAGSTRFDTAARVAERVGRNGAGAAYIVEGANADPARGWPDAVAVSALAALESRPILLVTHDSLPAASAQALNRLGVSNATVVGGVDAVAESVADEIRAMEITVDRVAGATRYATSGTIADRSIATGADGIVWLATGRDFPDALVAGPAAGTEGHPLLLVDGQSLDGSPAAREWLSAQRDRLTAARLVGGSHTISGEVEDEVKALLGDGRN